MKSFSECNPGDIGDAITRLLVEFQQLLFIPMSVMVPLRQRLASYIKIKRVCKLDGPFGDIHQAIKDFFRSDPKLFTHFFCFLWNQAFHRRT